MLLVHLRQRQVFCLLAVWLLLLIHQLNQKSLYISVLNLLHNTLWPDGINGFPRVPARYYPGKTTYFFTRHSSMEIIKQSSCG